MEPTARLIHKTFTSYLPTNMPVSFYGFPDGKIYIIYSRFYEIDFDHSGLEFVFARHEEFHYDFESQKLILLDNAEKLYPVAFELVDKPEPKIKIIKVSRNINSYNEAQLLLGEITNKMSAESTSGVFEPIL